VDGDYCSPPMPSAFFNDYFPTGVFENARSHDVENLSDDDLRRNPLLVKIVILKQRI
jgi:hypothetical protein